jgi:hypothetical protein
MSERRVRHLMGDPDKTRALGIVRGFDVRNSRPNMKKTGDSYSYVLKHTGHPGDGNNKYISCIFSNDGKLKKVIVGGLPELKPIEGSIFVGKDSEE